MIAIWRRLLGHSHFTLEDDFFQIGGHSLLLTRMASLIEEEFGRRLLIADVFQHPTIEQLTQRLGRTVSENSP